MTYEIRKAQNGYVIFEGGNLIMRGMETTPFVFETIDNALSFLKEKFEPNSSSSVPPSNTSTVKKWL